MKIRIAFKIATALAFILVLISSPLCVYSSNLSHTENSQESPPSKSKQIDGNKSNEMDNHTPSQPIIPRGVNVGTIDTVYRFNCLATDRDEEKLQYRFNWGDGNISPWGVESQMHSWEKPGSYKIAAQARNSHGRLSPWSDLHEITLSNESSFIISSQSGPNGHIFPQGEVNVPQGKSQRFEIKSDPHYHISDVMIDGIKMGPITNYTFSNVTGNHSITASFSIKIHTIHTISEGEGQISPSGSVPVVSGSDQLISITPNPYYQIKDVLVNDKSIGVVSSYQFFKISKDHKIRAIFTSENKSPIANAGLDQIVSSNTTVQLNAANSFDPDDGIKSFHWAQIEGKRVNISSSSDAQPTFDTSPIEKIGETLKFKLIVEDNSGQTASDTVSVHVTGNNYSPMIDPIENFSVNTANPFTVSTRFEDRNKNDTHWIYINWGDKTPLENILITTDNTISSDVIRASHLYEKSGVYKSNLCISDQNGAIGCTQFEVTSTNTGSPVEIINSTFSEGTENFEYFESPLPPSDHSFCRGEWTESQGLEESGALKTIISGSKEYNHTQVAGFKRTFSINNTADATLSFNYHISPKINSHMNVVDKPIILLDGRPMNEKKDTPTKSEETNTANPRHPMEKEKKWEVLSIDLGKLNRGQHTIEIGLFAERKINENEKVELIIDNIAIIGLFSDDEKPVGGFTENYKLPKHAILQSLNGDGLFSISFKIKDPFNDLCRIHQFEYSNDGGKAWHAPLNKDLSQSLELGWQTNSEQLYTSAPTFEKAETHFFTWDIHHPDNSMIDHSKPQNIIVRFQINDGTNDSQFPVTSESFDLENVPAQIHISFRTQDINHVPSGYLTIQADLTKRPTTIPQIFIERPLPMMALGPLNMKGSGLNWNYRLPIPRHNGSTVLDGMYKVIVFGISDADGKTIQKEGIFTTDTLNIETAEYRSSHNSSGKFLHEEENLNTEAESELYPLANQAYHSPIKMTLPHQDDGVINSRFVSPDSSISMLIEDDTGIDSTVPSNIVLTISDSKNSYTRDLSRNDVIRVFELKGEPKTKLTRFWLIYDRINDEFGAFDFDETYTISIDLTNRDNSRIQRTGYQFHTESRSYHKKTTALVPYSTSISKDDPLLENAGGYSDGIYIYEGALTGARVLFSEASIISPYLKHSLDLPILLTEKPQWTSIPLNIGPLTISNTPIKLFLPYPKDANPEHLSISYFDGTGWKSTDNVFRSSAPKSHQWIVPGSLRIHSDNSPPLIEIETYFHTAFQLTSISNAKDDTGESLNKTSCFISTLKSE